VALDIDGGERVDLTVEVGLHAKVFSALHAALPGLPAAT
jgi:hypothetical protein